MRRVGQWRQIEFWLWRALNVWEILYNNVWGVVYWIGGVMGAFCDIFIVSLSGYIILENAVKEIVKKVAIYLAE